MDELETRDLEHQNGDGTKAEDMTYFSLNTSKIDENMLRLGTMTGDMTFVKLSKEVIELLQDIFAANRVLESVALRKNGGSMSQTMEELGLSHESFERALRILMKLSG